MSADRRPQDEHNDIVYPSVLPFVFVHVGCLAAIWTGVTWQAVAIGTCLYWLRMFAITAGYHRYFSHRAYSTSRLFQFVLAFLAQSSLQKSVLWWAATHRHHHLHSDTDQDVHSPRQKGFIYSHLGWIFTPTYDATDLRKVVDLSRFPELMWLHRYQNLPGIALAGLCYLLAGWAGLVVGFLWSTVLVFHAVFCINSLAHVHGKQRYVTGDNSRNNWLLAFFTMGEGWHNNHHAYQSSVRQGFRWWEIDPTYYILYVLARLGVVWELKTPSAKVLRNQQRLSSRVVNRAAAQLAARFRSELVAQTFVSLQQPALPVMRPEAAVDPRGLPSRDQVLAEARVMFPKTASLNEIVDHTRNLIREAVETQTAPAHGGAAESLAK